MKDKYATEYTELRNAPHFIFNGKHTRDFNVNNVLVDSGLAKDTFLADRQLITERTRYNDKSYLLGYIESPLKFRIRLLFDPHKFTLANIADLRRWIDTDTYKEFKFDNEEESSLHIIMYAIVTGSSELSHNVINDGYLDLEFETNSSRKYSEILEDNYDFSITATEKVLKEYSQELHSLLTIEKNFMNHIKQNMARTNYANIEEFFKDRNLDRLPDGWKLISGSLSNITTTSTKLTLNNVVLRKRLNLINGRNYYMRLSGTQGKIRIHENDYNISGFTPHQFKFRKNILKNAGTFDIDSSTDGVGEGWTKSTIDGSVIQNSMFSLDLNTETQTINTNGKLTTIGQFSNGIRYVCIAETPSNQGRIKIQGKEYTNTDSLMSFKFLGTTAENTVELLPYNNTSTKYSRLRIYVVNEEEYNGFDTLTENQIREKYPHFDDHPYFDINFNGVSGTISNIEMWELNDVNKKRLDGGTPIDDIVGIDFTTYKSKLTTFESQLTTLKTDTLETFTKLESINGVTDLQNQYSKVISIFDRVIAKTNEYSLFTSDKQMQWEDVQPRYLTVKDFIPETEELGTEVINWMDLNRKYIDTSVALSNDTVEIFNFGDKEVYPIFEITSTDGSVIGIVNHSTNQITSIEDNIPNEVITMIGETEQIRTSRPFPYFKYDAHDDVFIKLKRGMNKLTFTGSCKVKIIYQFKLL